MGFEKINAYNHEVQHLKRFIDEVKQHPADDIKKAISICMENYTERLEGFLLSYHNPQSLNTKAILLRGCMEAYILSNIFFNGETRISTQFLEKRNQDSRYIQQSYSKEINGEVIHKRERFDYIGSKELYPNSLIELVDFSDLDEQTKRKFKYWIKCCDDTVHPYYNDLVQVDFYEVVFGREGLLDRLQSLVSDLFNRVFSEFQEFEYKHTTLKSINQFERDEFDQEVYSMMVILENNKQKVLLTLYQEFISHYFDLKWAMANQRKFLFYIKIRFILEFIGIFYILLKQVELQELYRLHSLVLRKDLVEYWVKIEPNNQVLKGFEKNYLLKYEERVNKLKHYFQTKYPHFDLLKIKHHIKQTNGFAIGFLSNKEKSPKTIDLINYSVKQLMKEHDQVFFKGLYVESCEYCHISAFSIENKSQMIDFNVIFDELKMLIKSLIFNIKINVNE